MSAYKFVSESGLKKAHKAVELVESTGKPLHSISLGEIDLAELKQAIADFELVEECGGIESCKKKFSIREACKPNATHFAIHPEKSHLIQLYHKNEPKLLKNYSFKSLGEAIEHIKQGLKDETN